jgi:ketosteroid isomerase-like protein
VEVDAMFKRILFAAFLVFISSFAAAQNASDDAIHDELRGLLSGIEAAINEERYGDLARYFHENARITTISQEFLASPDAIEPYFDHWFGEGAYLKKLKMELNADALTEFYADNTVGIVRGSGKEFYELADGRTYPMDTRWTATVIKDTDGNWRILSLHIGSNFLDNALLSAAVDTARNYVITAAVIGLVLGLVLGLLLGRRRKAA